jgi:hypothetical protein
MNVKRTNEQMTKPNAPMVEKLEVENMKTLEIKGQWGRDNQFVGRVGTSIEGTFPLVITERFCNNKW